MSRIVTSTSTITNAPHWSTKQAIFTTCREAHGPLSVRQLTSFAASSASAVLGPDLAMPGQGLLNTPTATGFPWNVTMFGGPNITFTQDLTYTWIRGHLINGRWYGSGANWDNLTPLTSTANANHATVEGYMDAYITNSLAYENSGYQTAWYGVYYCVQCSANPFAAVPANGDLYSYAPEFIKVSWRAVSITKPINSSVQNALASFGGLTVNAVPLFPMGFNVPILPPAMGAATLPAGNMAGGAVLGALPPNFPAAQGNGFDGEIEIHQT